ncbi:MAG TPA: 3-dehydroquinate synthase [Vitreimonas sp.]|uniref:3-dehydroquinate synthase n=1 Tax=Vitreimonas sp. TaxID=3069702 RepID=UPI002D4D655F|nr:3-dehydroquinate synthase [Vitreimonas sp.]HYD87690.1 3-dehydroquinate synthase [Vitreimonas sp.]
MTQTIPVNLDDRSYDVHVGPGLLGRAGALIAPFAPTKRVFIVTDQNLARLHRPALVRSLDAAGLKNWTVTLAPGESSKSFEGLELLCRHLLQAGINRKDLVIAFGGGVIGDLAGLAAGLVKRGVDFVQIPTTLLSQVDSSVGGKTAIDTPEGKNLVGLINQPRLVLADTEVLATLPERERRAGYAEIVKLGLISDAPFFAWCEQNAAPVIAGDPEALATAIAKAVAFKAGIVERDETEQGERALLNLGHTFAHALEGHAGYDGALLHGEAVAAGMGLAFELSAALGLCSEADAKRVRAHLSDAGFVTDLRKLPGAPFDVERLMQLAAADKKAQAGKLTFILARAPGRAFIEPDTPADVVRELLQTETRS